MSEWAAWLILLALVLIYLAIILVPDYIKRHREIKRINSEYEHELLMIEVRHEIKMEVMKQMYAERARLILEDS